MKNRHLLNMMLFLLVPLAMWGQEELTVYSDGTFNNPLLPIAGEAVSEEGLFQSEFIVPSAELTAMNGKTISVMTFYVATPASYSWGSAQFQVFMKEVNFTTLETFTGTDGATLVYSGALDATGSSMEVIFDNNYSYQGGNLLIGFYVTTPGTSCEVSFVGKMMEDDTAIIGLQNNPEYNYAVPCLPKTTFTYSSSAISCYKPRNLHAAVGPTTAVLDWNNGSDETLWQLSYSTTSGNPEGGTLVSVSSHPHTLSGLTTETTYYAYVRANCGEDYSDWSSVCSFTPTNSLALTLNEGGMYSGGFDVPIYSYFVNEGISSQFIIPAVELANVMNGQISKLTFYNMTPEISWGDAEFKVFLGEMEPSEFSGNDIRPWSEMTEVYSGSLSVSNGMMEVTLTTPYHYGTDNLVVGFNQTAVGTPGSQYNDMWYGVSASESNNALYSLGSSYTSAYAVPKTTIQYTQGTLPTCVRPRNLQASVYSQSATLTWENGLDESAWDVSYSTTEGSPASGTIETVTTKSYSISGLTNGTTYYAYVRANCGDSYSDWSTVCAFVPTDVAPTSNLTVYNGSYTGGGVPIQSQFTNYGIESQYIIPATNLTDVAYGQINSLTFYCNTASVSWGDAASFKVYLGETSLEHFNGTSIIPWDGLTEVYSGSLSVSEGNMIINFTTPYQFEGDNLVVGVKQTVNGTTANGVSWYGVMDSNGNTALYGVFGNYSSNYYLPKTTINYTSGTAPSCPKPKYMTTSETTAHSTKLSWTNGDEETSWVLQYATDEDFTQNVESVNVNTNPYVLAGLPSDITYYARVKAHCGEGDESDWSNICSFTPACPKPTDLIVSYLDATSAMFSWANGSEESAWVLEYATNSAFSQNVVSVDVLIKPYSLTGLASETTYYARIKADCGNGDESAWSNVCSFTPYSDKVTVNCGSISNKYVPVYGLFVDEYSKSQFIIPSATMGTVLVDADITQIAFYCENTTVDFGAAEFDVYVKEVTNTAFTSTTLDWMGMTAVYSGQLGVNNYMMTIELNEPYLYNGGNLLIGIKQTKSGSYGGTPWLGIATDYYSAIGGYESSKSLACHQFIPKTTFTYTKETCPMPTNLNVNGITTNTASLSWTAGDGFAWQVQYKASSASEWSESIPVSETPSCTMNNLTPATEYQARVRTVCGTDDYSDWVTSESFTTDCGYMTIPYSHNFDSDATGHVAPNCWHFSDGSYPYIYESNTNAHSGNHYLQIKKNSDYAATLVLPEIDTDEHPIGSLQLTFWARASQSTYYYDYLYVGVMTDPNDMSTFQSVQGASTNLSTTTYKKFELYLDNWTGEGNYIALRYGGSTTYYIDDIEVSVAPTCRQPLEPSSNYSNAHEASIRWKTRDLRQCNYQVSYSTTENFNPNDGTIVDVEFENTLVNAGTPYRDYTLACLNASTTYYFYVRANCGEGDFSEWSDDYASFTTGVACSGPDYVSVTAKNSYAKFEWSGDTDDEWDFQYKEASSEEWLTPTDFVVSPGYELYLNYTLHGLTPGTEYDARLRKHCGMCACPEVDDGYSDWYEFDFSTYDGCWDGDPWMCTSHLGTQATLRWLNNGPDMRWQIRYRLSTEYDYPEGNIVTTDVLPEATMQQYTLTGLTTNSTYYWQVRGYCDETSQSDWSDEDYFFTRSTDDYITVDKTHPYYEDFENGMPDDWSRMNLYNYDMEHYDAWERVMSSSLAGESFPASYCISSCRENMSWASDGSMILMPAIHIDENATSAVLSFWSKDAYNDSDARGTKMIWVNGNYLSTDYTAFDLGCVYQKVSKANYWRQCFVNLDDYIGQTVIIAFDYVVAHNYNNYDWWVDNVCLQVFDKVGGGEASITSGEWSDDDFWGGSVPGSGDDVIVNANVTVPDGVEAEANQIVINTDTINVSGNRVEKFGKLIIADGGQLRVKQPVSATLQKAINGYNRGGSNWYLLSTAVQEALVPDKVDGLLDETGYDLYQFDGSYAGAEWRNYKQHDDMTLKHGLGFLYANASGSTPAFTGTVLPSNQNLTVDLSYSSTTFGAWNLIGNPYPCNAYLQDGRSFYRMNPAGTELISASGVIKPLEGVFVQATGEDQSVVFTTTAPETSHGNGSLYISLSKNEPVERGGLAELDRATIRFDEGEGLGKFMLNDNATKVYVPWLGQDYAVVHAQPVGELPLNFKAEENGTYTLTVSSTFRSPFSVLRLIDHLTGADIDLLATPSYTFDARRSDYASRFKLVFATGHDFENGDFAFIANGEIIVNGSGTVQVIDMLGRIIVQRRDAMHCVSTTGMTPGVYLLRLINGDDVKTQKIIIK